jgi:rRNA-processing arch domain
MAYHKQTDNIKQNTGQVPVPMPLLCGLSSIRIAIPSDLRPSEARQNVLFAVQELARRYPQGLPKLHPLKVLHFYCVMSIPLLLSFDFCLCLQFVLIFFLVN